jgi:hypothetical protein
MLPAYSHCDACATLLADLGNAAKLRIVMARMFAWEVNRGAKTRRI